jgi:hypothetical protein
MENTDMQTIIDIFAEKMLQNLLYTDGYKDDGKQIIEVTLDTLDVFLSTPSSCRLLCKSTLIV